MAMKAWVLHGIGDIRYEDAEVPMLNPEEVRIKVKAVGICGSDIPRIYKTGAHRMPLIPGHEFSGVVDGVGKKTSPYWIGKRVGVYPLIPCGKCKPCEAGHPEMCRDYSYTGSRRDGAFAEYVSVPSCNLIELPANVSFEAAAMLEPMAVAAHAMQRGIGDGVNPNVRIVVCGLGTIGLLMVMLLKERGFQNIYVIGNKESQRERVMGLGVPGESFCNSSSDNVARWMQDTFGGADIYFECVGKSECNSYGIDGAAPGARLAFIGNPYSDMRLSKDTYWKILRNQLTITGSWNSTFQQQGNDDLVADDWHYVVKRLESGKIKPESLITHRMSLKELDKGFVIMRDKVQEYCKIMMVNPDPV